MGRIKLIQVNTMKQSENAGNSNLDLQPRASFSRRVAKTFLHLARSPVHREAFVNNFLKEFSYAHRLFTNLGHPQVYQLETTNQCPYTCVMCPRTFAMTRQLGHMDIGLFRDIIDQLRPAWQISNISQEPSIGLWHFGEPMVYRHFVESIVHCHSRGLQVCISTNPSVWAERRIDEVLDAGLDEIYVMIDGMDDETSIAVRGKAASFVRGEKNVRELARKKVERGLRTPRTHICMVKQPRNAHQWQLFREYWKGIDGIDEVFLGDFSTFAGDVMPINQIAETFAAQDSEQAAFASRSRSLSQFPCYYPWHSVSVTWEGKVVPCCRDHNACSVLGDLRKESLESIWNGDRMKALRAQFLQGNVTAAPCASCKERSLEIGLPGRYYPVAGLMRATGSGKMPDVHQPDQSFLR